MLPRLTRFYGIQPPDIDAMTPREVDEYIVQLSQLAQEELEAISGG